MTVDLDLELKTAEPDRWLSTRFVADPEKRADVVALYAFDHTLARIAHIVTQPMLGEIRLAWWREAAEEAVAGKASRAHPVVEALSVAIGRRGLDIAPFETLIEAHARDLDATPLSLDEAVDLRAKRPPAASWRSPRVCSIRLRRRTSPPRPRLGRCAAGGREATGAGRRRACDCCEAPPKNAEALDRSLPGHRLRNARPRLRSRQDAARVCKASAPALVGFARPYLVFSPLSRRRFP